MVWGDTSMRFLIGAAMALVLAGCSSTPADLEAKAAPTIQAYPENYQEIYRRVSTTAKRCWAEPINAQAQMAVDAELYPDLGYGEVTLSLINWGTRNYYVSTKIERAMAGSKMTLRSGNSIDETRAKLVQQWAAGSAECRLI